MQIRKLVVVYTELPIGGCDWDRVQSGEHKAMHFYKKLG